MKNYAQISSAYEQANGFRRCFIRDICGEPKMHLLTEPQIKRLQRRGVNLSAGR